MMLFALAADDAEPFTRALTAFCNGRRDKRTIALLAES
jgi:uncharacterized protein (DUF1810 family)